MTKKESSEIFSTKAAFSPKSLIFPIKSSIFSRKSSIFPQNLYKFDLGFSGVFSVARLGFSIFLLWQHCLRSGAPPTQIPTTEPWSRPSAWLGSSVTQPEERSRHQPTRTRTQLPQPPASSLGQTRFRKLRRVWGPGNHPPFPSGVPCPGGPPGRPRPDMRTQQLALRPAHHTLSAQLLGHRVQVAGCFWKTFVKLYRAYNLDQDQDQELHITSDLPCYEH